MTSFNLYKLVSKSTPVAISVADTVVHRMAEGLGFNWFSCFDPSVYPASTDEKRWERLFTHAEQLNMGLIRFLQLGNLICDDSGAFMPSHVSFDQLRRLNAWAENSGATFLLNPFVIPPAHQYAPWDGAPTPWGNGRDYHPGVKDLDAFVNKFVVPFSEIYPNRLIRLDIRFLLPRALPDLSGLLPSPQASLPAELAVAFSHVDPSSIAPNSSPHWEPDPPTFYNSDSGIPVRPDPFP